MARTRSFTYLYTPFTHPKGSAIKGAGSLADVKKHIKFSVKGPKTLLFFDQSFVIKPIGLDTPSYSGCVGLIGPTPLVFSSI
jgi:hypothetical protein